MVKCVSPECKINGVDSADRANARAPREQHESQADRAEGTHPDVASACGDQPLTGDIQ